MHTTGPQWMNGIKNNMHSYKSNLYFCWRQYYLGDYFVQVFLSLPSTPVALSQYKPYGASMWSVPIIMVHPPNAGPASLLIPCVTLLFPLTCSSYPPMVEPLLQISRQKEWQDTNMFAVPFLISYVYLYHFWPTWSGLSLFPTSRLLPSKETPPICSPNTLKFIFLQRSIKHSLPISTGSLPPTMTSKRLLFPSLLLKE